MWHQLRALVPVGLKQVLREAAYVGLLSDLDSLRTYRELMRDRHGPRRSRQVRVRQLGGRTVQLRGGTTDAATVFTTFFHRFHLPPRTLRRAPIILDLGANIGLTMAHFAQLYSDARVIGVELDQQNAALCRRNIEPWARCCTLLEGAVWREDGELEYEINEGSEDAFTVAPHEPSKGGRMVRAKTWSLNTILRENGDPSIVDYVKMDIEGAEREVLRNNVEWAARVRSIKVELHGDYTTAQCATDLRALGFDAHPDTRHSLCVVGVR